jgi:soluble lytic murein transglycosylase
LGVRILKIVAVVAVTATLVVLWWRNRREHSQDAVIAAAGTRYAADPALIKAIIWKESWFDPQARGRAGEIGLMQIREAAAIEWAAAENVKTFSIDHLFDPRTNTLAGTWYLQRLLKRYRNADDPRPYALAAYNAGPANVAKWSKGAAQTNSNSFIAQIGFPGTKHYVTAILRRQERYRGTLPVNTARPAKASAKSNF